MKTISWMFEIRSTYESQWLTLFLWPRLIHIINSQYFQVFLHEYTAFWSNFRIIMFFRPFFWEPCMRSKPPIMPPRSTQRFWIQMYSRDWWKRVVLKECSDGKWSEDFWMSHWSLKKMCATMEENHVSLEWDSVCSSTIGDKSGNSTVYHKTALKTSIFWMRYLHVQRKLLKLDQYQHIPRRFKGKC